MKSQNGTRKGSEFGQRFGEFVLRYRWPVLIGTILLAMGLGYGGQFIQFDSDYHVFFSKQNPQLQAFDALQEKYTKDDNVLIVLEPQDGKVFTKETLDAIEHLTNDSWQTPYSTRVDAITNFQHTRAVEDDLYVDDLVEGALNMDDEQINSVRSIALNEPLLVNRLVSSSGDVTAINITVKLPGEDITEGSQVIAAVREMVGQFEADHPEINTYLSGMIMLSGAFFEASQNDMSTLIPLMFLIIIITIMLATRSISSTVSTLVVIILSIVAAMGFAGWAGIRLTPPSAAAPTIILTLAIADSIHVLITMLQSMRMGKSKRDAIVESLRLNFMPIFITSLTTIIGFLSMNFSEVPPFRDLGNITSIGMLAAFLFSVTTLPIMMSLLPVRVKVKEETGAHSTGWLAGQLDRLANFIILNNKRVMWLTAISIIGMSALIVKNELNDEFIEYFDKSVDFRTDTDFISERLTGIYNIEFSLGAGESGGVNNPEYLANLEKFETWLTDQPEVIHVNSYAEVARRVNRSMHGDEEAYYAMPVNREEAAQYLLLYEMSLPYGLDLNNQINVDKSETRLTATLKNLSSAELINLTVRTEDWLKSNTPTYMHTEATSTSTMFSHLTGRQIRSMILGTGLA